MNKGDSSDDCLPKFFKVYLPDDSGDDLDIPISFNSFLPKPLPEYIIVRSIYGNIWKLKLRKHCGDDVDKVSMLNGWKRIVKDEDLKGGEFLAFEFDCYRLFNFCIYGQATCKRLGSSVKTKEITDESEGEDGKSGVDVIVIDDDSTDDDDDDDSVSSGQEDESDDDDDDDVIVIDDDDDDDDDDDEVDDEDVDVDVEADDVDDGMEADGDDDHRQLLDDPDSPSFTVILNPKKKSQLLIPSHIMKDYNLHFTERITIVDPLVPKFGTLERKIKLQDNGCLFVKGFGSVFRRNNVKTTDTIICEVKKNGNDVAHILKVHIVRGL
ncbi:B3 domain-containing protein At5g60130 isoform X3 [Brassica napus]|uniref:B3 domain-containing protein At5g60130 isoform X3 n=1 Tax=Brassica napus TaxID=3708 RepID=UPI00207AFD1D|nr:B3 domain-containing protein At5g60130 isoform X3 [Brassica napus]